MELPTYTNIWKIEKRLYKLYDFRLPMPLPVGQIVAFLAIAVPYMLILTMVGMPFSHTWLWLYLLPPGVLAWLVTRPVLEGKRLPELLLSQMRYLGEPKTWCRMAPLAEKDEMLIVARAWRSAAHALPAEVPAAEIPAEAVSADAPAVPHPATSVPVAPEPVVPVPVVPEPATIDPAVPGVPVPGVAAPELAVPGRPEWPERAAPRLVRERAAVQSAAVQSAAVHPAAVQSAAAPSAPAPSAPAPSAPSAPAAVPVQPRSPEPAGSKPAWPNAPASRPPAVQVTRGTRPAHSLNTVERALRNSPGGWNRHEPVVVVPGGHRPGKPDQVQRDQARVRLPLPGPARVVVLGCTAGAGQTVVTLLTGQLLASLRGQAVAVIDLGDGQGSLTEMARSIPVLLPSVRAGGDPAGQTRERGLQVVSAAGSDAGQVIDSVVERYPLILADPDAGSVPKSLRVTDQLVLVAPASDDATSSLAMTLEWLEANGYRRLSEAAIIVLNGVSSATSEHAAKAAAVASGRCRAIVQVPWDERLRDSRPLATPTVRAYTALAGVLVAALADLAARSGAR